MKKTKLEEIRYVLDLSEGELSTLGAALHYCLFENPDFICCESCRAVGIKVFDMTLNVFMKNHKHS